MHVLDASRAIGVCTTLLDPIKRDQVHAIYLFIYIYI